MEMPLNAEATFTSVQRYLIGPKCLSCHNGPGSPKGIDLSSYEAIMERGLVQPFKGNSDSPFYDSISGSPPRMPKNAPPLSAMEIALVKKWIDNGALKSGVPVPPDPPPTPTYAWISGYLFEKRCNGCHNGKHAKTSLDLRTYDKMMEYQGEILKAVEPGEPELSLLFSNLDGGFMPPPKKPGAKLDQEIIDAVAEWIRDGALETPKGNP